MKKVYTMVVLVVLVTSNLLGTSYASSSSVASNVVSDVAEDKAVPTYTLDVNGSELQLDDHYIPVFKSKEQYMVPVRKVAEALGYTVHWGQDKKEIIIQDSIQSIQLSNKSAKVKVEGKLKVINLTRKDEMPTQAQIYQGRLYVPAQFFELFFNEVVTEEGHVSISPVVYELQ